MFLPVSDDVVVETGLPAESKTQTAGVFAEGGFVAANGGRNRVSALVSASFLTYGFLRSVTVMPFIGCGGFGVSERYYFGLVIPTQEESGANRIPKSGLAGK